jgi:hypothetical protein
MKINHGASERRSRSAPPSRSEPVALDYADA